MVGEGRIQLLKSWRAPHGGIGLDRTLHNTFLLHEFYAKHNLLTQNFFSDATTVALNY